MPSPSKSTPNTSTPPRLRQIPGQSNIDAFVRVSRPLLERHDANKENPNAPANNTPLLRRRRIQDDDDDDDVLIVNNTLQTNGRMNPVQVDDTENESDVNFGVIMLPQRQSSHDQPAEGSKSRRTQSPAPAELAVTEKPVRFRYQIGSENFDDSSRTSTVLWTKNNSTKTKH